MRSEWTEGVCGDGAAILRDGHMIPIEEVVAILNRFEGSDYGPSWFDYAAAVERLAFSIPAPNEFTPQLMALAVSMRMVGNGIKKHDLR